MFIRKQALTLFLVLAAIELPIAGRVKKGLSAATAKEEITRGEAVLWRDPGDIVSRNLFYGTGGKEHEPRGTFTFIEEDLDGTSPKIVVRDENRVKWKVKLGAEARPETAASRLIWAIGYFANEDYFAPSLTVRTLPRRLHRGQRLVAPDGSLTNVRLKRYLEGEKKIGNWSWHDTPFADTRQLNGLRVMMALLNNWDVTDENNAVYQDSNAGEQRYMVSDVGSTFGTGTLTWPMRNARGNLSRYRRSRFITSATRDSVNFYVPARPSLFFLATPREYFHKLQLRWIGKRIPRNDARWIGEVLSRLSLDQIRDAFRAAGYPYEEVEGFATVLRDRIAQLRDL